jgi:hypothetical protein
VNTILRLTFGALCISCLLAACIPLTASTNEVVTVAGGYVGDGKPATSASLASPWDVVFDAKGNLYVSDFCSWIMGLADPVPTPTLTLLPASGDVSGAPSVCGLCGCEPFTVCRQKLAGRALSCGRICEPGNVGKSTTPSDKADLENEATLCAKASPRD